MLALIPRAIPDIPHPIRCFSSAGRFVNIKIDKNSGLGMRLLVRLFQTFDGVVRVYLGGSKTGMTQ